jgi:hypothetical protein
MIKLQNTPISLTILYLLNNNPIFKKIILKKYKSIMYYLKLNVQTGGTPTIKTLYNNETFGWYKIEDNIWILSDEDDKDCISITIDKESNEAYINNINADTVRCGQTIINNQGSHLIKLVLQFLNENKILLNINKILLKDNASKICKNNKSIILRIFLTLLTGETWYTKYGFRPIDEKYKKDYRYNRDVMNSVKLNDIDFIFILNKILKYKNKNMISNDQSDYFINVYNQLKNNDPLVKDLLFVIFRKDNYNFMCSVFELIYDKLILLLKLKSKYLNEGIIYELKI